RVLYSGLARLTSSTGGAADAAGASLTGLAAAGSLEGRSPHPAAISTSSPRASRRMSGLQWVSSGRRGAIGSPRLRRLRRDAPAQHVAPVPGAVRDLDLVGIGSAAVEGQRAERGLRALLPHR